MVLGRPGAGKTTIADCAVSFLSEQESLHYIGLDLDVCVAQWMRENFDRGVYPMLRERQEFALGSCDYVDAKLQEQALLHVDTNITMAAIVSFSFVNTDLQDIYRYRFPHAVLSTPPRWKLLTASTNASATSSKEHRPCKINRHCSKITASGALHTSCSHTFYFLVSMQWSRTREQLQLRYWQKSKTLDKRLRSTHSEYR